MATMQEVAQLAGVSISTVSYAISGNRPISEATRAKIDAAMAELNFAPHAAARALASKKTRVLAVAYPVYGVAIGATLNAIVAGAAHEAARAGYSLVLWPVSSQEPEVITKLASDRSADAVLLMEVALQDPRIQALQELGITYGLIGCNDDPSGLSWVDVNWDGCLQAAVDHLVSLGHREIAYIGRDQASVEAGYGPAVRGFTSFRAAMSQHGLTGFETPCDLSPQAGHRAVDALLAARPQTTAILVMNELALFGVTAALRERGLATPDDVSVTAVAIDTAIADLFEPALTHVQLPGELEGSRAVRGLLSVLDGLAPPEGALIDCSLVPRETTGPPRTL